MKNMFIKGGPLFMGALSIILVFTTAWIIYHFIVAYNSKHADKTSSLRKLGYGKLMGIFALVTGILGQMVGLTAMFDAIEQVLAVGGKIKPELVFGGIKATMIVTIYGMLIYLFSVLLWFSATVLIDKKHANLASE
jgi:MotA/TolQ/ExbB proton channel family